MKSRKFVKISGLLLSLLLAFECVAGLSQSRKPADWLTDGGKPQPTAWQRDENILTTANVKKMKLLWKIKLDNQPREMHNLLPALVVGSVETAGGPKQIVIVTGVSDNIYAIDADKGELLWKHHFETSWTPPPGGRGVSARSVKAPSTRTWTARSSPLRVRRARPLISTR